MDGWVGGWVVDVPWRTWQVVGRPSGGMRERIMAWKRGERAATSLGWRRAQKGQPRREEGAFWRGGWVGGWEEEEAAV